MKQPALPIRILLTFGWIICIFCLLYIPNFKESSPKDRLNIFTWGDVFDEETIRNFEKEHHIKVNLNYYDSNEELLVKLKATHGKGHDLIIPSDYAVKILIEQELVEPLDKSKLNFIDKIEPKLLGLDYDPSNTYSLPLQWEIYGLSYDGTYFDPKPDSWATVFQDQPYRVAMTNDPIEAFSIANFYLHGKTDHISNDQIEATHQLLKNQKKQVEAYANYRAGYLIATKNCPIAVTASSFHYRMASDFDFIRFSIPKEGSFVTIENIAIPIQAQNKDELYTFLNFIYQKEKATARSKKLTAFPVIKNSLPDDNPEFQKTHSQALKNIHQCSYFRHLIPEQTLREIWVRVKS